MERVGVMKITVFGATGATGSKVVDRALFLGHKVIAFVRRPQVLTPKENLRVHYGDVFDFESVKKAIVHSDAVISCIGPAKNFSPGTVVSIGTSHIVAACERLGVQRFVFQSGITLSEGKELTFFNQLSVKVLRRIYWKACDDKAIAEKRVKESSLDWVIVRPVGLKQAPGTLKYIAGPQAPVRPFTLLSFADCADGLVRASTSEPSWTRQVVNVGRR